VDAVTLGGGLVVGLRFMLVFTGLLLLWVLLAGSRSS
jgi:hypothetical protein